MERVRLGQWPPATIVPSIGRQLHSGYVIGGSVGGGVVGTEVKSSALLKELLVAVVDEPAHAQLQFPAPPNRRHISISFKSAFESSFNLIF
jgi:hypothetical protein